MLMFIYITAYITHVYLYKRVALPLDEHAEL